MGRWAMADKVHKDQAARWCRQRPVAMCSGTGPGRSTTARAISQSLKETHRRQELGSDETHGVGDEDDDGGTWRDAWQRSPGEVGCRRWQRTHTQESAIVEGSSRRTVRHTALAMRVGGGIVGAVAAVAACMPQPIAVWHTPQTKAIRSWQHHSCCAARTVPVMRAVVAAVAAVAPAAARYRVASSPYAGSGPWRRASGGNRRTCSAWLPPLLPPSWVTKAPS